MFVACYVLGFLSCGLEAVGVVVGKEGEQAVGVGVYTVHGHQFVETGESVVPEVCLFVDAGCEHVHERKVHDCLKL